MASINLDLTLTNDADPAGDNHGIAISLNPLLSGRIRISGDRSVRLTQRDRRFGGNWASVAASATEIDWTLPLQQPWQQLL